jgi:hypothetical protein
MSCDIEGGIKCNHRSLSDGQQQAGADAPSAFEELLLAMSRTPLCDWLTAAAA